MPRKKSMSLVEKAAKFKGITDSGILKSWMICEVIRQELGLSIDTVTNSFYEKVVEKKKKKRNFKCAFMSGAEFRFGVNNISPITLQVFIELMLECIPKENSSKFDLNSFDYETLFVEKRFVSIEELQGFLYYRVPISIDNDAERQLDNKLKFDLKVYEELERFVNPKISTREEDSSNIKNTHSFKAPIKLLAGGVYSGKTIIMRRLFLDLQDNGEQNLIYINLTTIKNVIDLQQYLTEALISEFKKYNDYQGEEKLLSLIRKRSSWIIFIDTADQSIYSNNLSRFLMQSQYLAFLLKVIRKPDTNIKIILSEQSSGQDLPLYMGNEVDEKVTKPQNPVAYFQRKYQSSSNTKVFDELTEMTESFEYWDEKQRYIFSDILSITSSRQLSATKVHKLVSKYNQSFNIEKTYLKIVLLARNKHHSDLQTLLLVSLILVQEGFSAYTFQDLMLSKKWFGGEDGLIGHHDIHDDICAWISLFTTQKVDGNNQVLLKPALRTIFIDGGLNDHGEWAHLYRKAQSIIHKFTKELLKNATAKSTTKQLRKLDLTTPENYQRIHSIASLGVYDFQFTKSKYLSKNVSLTARETHRQKVIRKLYDIYNNFIELNILSDDDNTFALANVFLVPEIKLQLTSEILSINSGDDNGRLISTHSSIYKSLTFDEIFKLLESLSVASIARLRYGSAAKASYLLGSLLNRIDENEPFVEKKEKQELAVLRRRISSRIYNNDTFLKFHFNGKAVNNPIQENTYKLFTAIQKLEKDKAQLDQVTYFIRRLLKLWVNCAFEALAGDKQKSMEMSTSLSLVLAGNDAPTEGTKFTKQFTASIELLKDIVFKNVQTHKNSINRYESLKKAMNTYSATTHLLVAQRLFLFRILKDRLPRNKGEKSKGYEDVTNLMLSAFDVLLFKFEQKFQGSLTAVATLSAYKTSLMRAMASSVEISEYLLRQNVTQNKLNSQKFASFKSVFYEKLESVDKFDDAALFINPYTSNRIYHGYYYVRLYIKRMFSDGGTGFTSIQEEASKRIKQEIIALEKLKEIRISLELELFSCLASLLNDINHKFYENNINFPIALRNYKSELRDLFQKFVAQDRGDEVLPIFELTYSCLDLVRCGSRRVHESTVSEYKSDLRLIIVMYF